MAYRDVVLPDNPMVYWRLGEASGTVAQDETANNTDGTYSSLAILGATGIISGDTALTIADDTDPAVPNGFVRADSTVTMNDTFSFECWLKRNSTTAIERGIFEGFSWATASMDASGQIYLVPGASGTKIMHSSINITDTDWHHLVITKSGATRKIYIDSVDRTVLDTNATLASGLYTLYVGASHNAAGTNLYGGFTYDEAAYYTTALTASQVSAHYEAVFPPPSPPPPSGPTRFYLPSTGAAAVSPAYASQWDDTVNAASRLTMVRTRINSAFATITPMETTSSSVIGLDLLARQYVSEPIVGDQTISGTLNGQMRMSDTSPTTQGDWTPQMIVRVVSNDGSTVRGTTHGGDTRTTNVDEITATLRNQRNPATGISPVTLSSVSALDGDRIVVEIGARNQNFSTANVGINVRFGDNNASDLTEGGTETTDLNPWIEFSMNINFDVLPMVERVGMVPI